jgi:hypothetical protein
MLLYSILFVLIYIGGAFAIGWFAMKFVPNLQGSSPSIGHFLAVGGALATAWLFAKRHQRLLSPEENRRLVAFCVSWVLVLEGLSLAAHPEILSLPPPILLGVLAFGLGFDVLIVWLSFRYVARRALIKRIPEQAPIAVLPERTSWGDFAKPYLLAPILVLVAIVAGIVIVKLRILFPIQVTVADIPHVLDKVSTASRRPAFGEFVFTTPDRQARKDAVHLRLSVENGQPGVDWVLVAPRNIEDKDAFIAFARRRGYSLAEHRTNGVSYLRIENGDLADVCAEVVTKLYFRPRSEPMELKVEGFEWDQ